MAREQPSLVIKRDFPNPHYEVHYSNRVEFWDISMEKKIGQSKVYGVRERKDGSLHIDREADDEDVEEF